LLLQNKAPDSLPLILLDIKMFSIGKGSVAVLSKVSSFHPKTARNGPNQLKVVQIN